eukprot:2901994-Pleurochrysis_carterae.AAC.3
MVWGPNRKTKGSSLLGEPHELGKSGNTQERVLIVQISPEVAFSIAAEVEIWPSPPVGVAVLVDGGCETRRRSGVARKRGGKSDECNSEDFI